MRTEAEIWERLAQFKVQRSVLNDDFKADQMYCQHVNSVIATLKWVLYA